MGTVTTADSGTQGLVFQPDSGDRQVTRVTPDTVLQRILPGEKDLKKAEPIHFGDIAAGDRILVTTESGATEARRVILVSAKDISNRIEADQKDWAARGISGIVSAKNGNEITVTVKSAGAEHATVVALNDRTTYKRYAPDSVRFADAKSSKAQEIQIGDQLRARGAKNTDGSKLAAEDVVFGTFLTKAGSVTAIDPNTHEIHITELGTGKALVVKLTADTQIKAMPDFGAGGPPQFSAGGRGGVGPPSGGPPSGGPPNGAAGFGPPPGAAGPPGGAAGAPDPVQMIERMPVAGVDAIKAGQTVIVSSTKGASADQVTAIVVVANAQMLIQMATRPPAGGGGRGRPDNAAAGLSPGVMGGGLGFDLSGMMAQ
jgi:hypothetical protein